MISCGIVCTQENRIQCDFLFESFNVGFYNAVPIILEKINSKQEQWPVVDCIIESPFDKEVDFKIECRKHYGESNVFPLLNTKLEDVKEKIHAKFVDPLIKQLTTPTVHFSALAKYLLFREAEINHELSYVKVMSRYVEALGLKGDDPEYKVKYNKYTANVYMAMSVFKSEKIVDSGTNKFKGVDSNLINFFVKQGYPMTEAIYKPRMKQGTTPYYMPKAPSFGIVPDYFKQKLAHTASTISFIPPPPPPIIEEVKEEIVSSSTTNDEIRTFLENMEYGIQTTLLEFKNRVAFLEERMITNKQLDAAFMTAIDKATVLEKLTPKITELSKAKLESLNMIIDEVLA